MRGTRVPLRAGHGSDSAYNRRQVGSHCYWSVTVSGSDDIVQNDIPGGGYPQVTVSDGQQLKLMDCGTFAKQ